MLIVHTPAGGTPEEFDIRSVRVNEASIVSRTMDTTWKKVKERLFDDDPEAMQAVAWVIKKRTEPSLRLADFNPVADELAVRLDKAEVESWVAEALGALDDTVTSEQALIVMQPIIDAAVDAEFARDLILRLHATPKDPADSPAETEGPNEKTEESTPTEPDTSASSPTSSTSTDEPSTT